MASGSFGVSVTWSGGTAEIRWGESSTNSGANTSVVYCELWAHTSGFTTYGSGSWNLTIDGTTYTSGGTVSVSSSWVKVASASKTVTHNSNGAKTITVGVTSGGVSGTSWSATSGTSSVGLTDFVRLPGTPSAPSFSNVTPTTATVSWSAPSSAVSISQYDLHVCDSQNHNSTSCYVFYNWTGSSATSKSLTGMLPGTKYYAAVRAQSSEGTGSWSAWGTVTTLSSDPPSISVTASPTGTSSTVSLSPPGGISGVNSYNIEYRVKGSSTATSTSTTTSTKVITGLTPGTTYEYRSSAVIGTYTSPWTAWTELKQPAPSTEPGAYFDGSTDPTDDQTYQWTGTANNSTSQAVGVPAKGWRDFATAAADSGGTGTMARVSDPFSGTYASRATFNTDATADGFRAGPIGTSGIADVTEYTDYTASIYVKPSRSQRFAIEIRWLDAGQGFLSATQGVAQVVSAGAFTRLTVSGTSPAGAEFATVNAVDVAGDGWSVFLGGESVTTDAAMLTVGNQVYAYFDGDSVAAGYKFSWLGVAGESESVRTAVEVAASDPLRDPDCDPLPLPPRPPVIAENCITDIALWRRYTVVIPPEYTYDWQDVVPTFRLTTATDYPGIPGDIRQVRIRVYPNPFGYVPALVDVSTWCAEMIISYIPSDTVLTIDGEIQRTFAEVKGAAAIPADHLVYGTGGVPPTWPVLECGIGYMVTFDTPLEGLTPVEDLKPEILLTRKF